MDSPGRAMASLFGRLCWTTAAGALFSRRLLPYSVDGVFKQSLLRLFNLAYENKYQLPLLITVAFMALDVRLQIEINVFWDRPPTPERDRAPPAPRQRAIQQTLQPPAPTAADLADSNTSLEVNVDAADAETSEWEEDAAAEYEDLDHWHEEYPPFMHEEHEHDYDDDEGPPLVVQVEFRHT